MSWLKTALKAFTNPIGTLIDAGTSIIGGLLGKSSASDTNRTNERIANAQIESQKSINADNLAMQQQINAANLAHQQDINKQNIALARETNALERRDARNAISDKKMDLIRAGYSTADPTLQGFSAAALSAPRVEATKQEAMQQEVPFNASLAASLIGANTALSNRRMEWAKAMSDMALQRAQSANLRADTTGKEIDNKYKDAEHVAALEKVNAEIENIKADTKIKEQQKENLRAEFDKLKMDYKIAGEEYKQAKFKTDHQSELFTEELNLIKANVASVETENDIKKLEKEILGFKRDAEKAGIPTESNNFWNTLVRMLFQAQKHPELLNSLKQMVVDGVDIWLQYRDEMNTYGENITPPKILKD